MLFKKDESQFHPKDGLGEGCLKMKYDFRAYHRDTGQVYNINSSRFRDEGTLGRVTLTGKAEIEAFVEQLVDAQGLFSNTINGKAYTDERGQQRVLELLEQGQLSIYILKEFIPPECRNHHKAVRKPEKPSILPFATTAPLQKSPTKRLSCKQGRGYSTRKPSSGKSRVMMSHWVFLIKPKIGKLMKYNFLQFKQINLAARSYL